MRDNFDKIMGLTAVVPLPHSKTRRSKSLAKNKKRDKKLTEQYGDAYEEEYGAFLEHNYDR